MEQLVLILPHDMSEPPNDLQELYFRLQSDRHLSAYDSCLGLSFLQIGSLSVLYNKTKSNIISSTPTKTTTR